MLAYTYRKQGEFALQNKPEPVLTHVGDAVVRVTMSSICTSDLHIKHGSCLLYTSPSPRDCS